MMRKWIFSLISLLLLTNPILCSKNGNSTNYKKASHKDNNSSENRIKRSLHSESENLFMPFRTKLIDLEDKDMKIKSDLEQPFWGMRGRRENSEENDLVFSNSGAKDYITKTCKNCYKILYSNAGSRDEPMSPFWGNRGKRNSDEIENNAIPDNPFWGNRGKRQEEEPFWGTRGRREPDLPFWGSRGRREGIQLNNLKILNAPTYKNHDDTEPFWGNRGRKKSEADMIFNTLHENAEPFWGNRGKRDTLEPFWGSRGRRNAQNEMNEQSDELSANKGRRKELLKKYILNTINNVENDIENLSRLRRTERVIMPYWSKIGRQSMFQRGNFMDTTRNFGLHFRPSEPQIVLDHRMFAEQPHYILVQRSSRSSDDPFYITRGKKYINQNLAATSRDRRGAIEELVKSVRNDPYYIARGKKNSENTKTENSSNSKEEFAKAVDLICSTIDLTVKGKDYKVKREINDNERDRRTILKKLADQLQTDPYFVSRGKKSEISGINEDNLEEFMNHVAVMCN